MTDTLFIYLSSLGPAMQVEATVLAADGAIRHPAYSTTLESLAASHAGARVVGLIPGSEALSTSAVLPKVGASQLRKMLPFAIEDQIAGELADQHFAMGRPIAALSATDKAAVAVSVIVIRRETIGAYRDALRAVGLEPVQMYLDESCVAAKPGDVIAWVQGDEVFLRSPDGLGLRCRIEDLSTTLELIPADTPLSSLGLQVFGASTHRSSTDHEFEKIAHRFSRVTHTNLGPNSLNWLVTQRALGDPINLLQGDLSPHLPGRWLDTRWKPPAIFAAVLLALVLIDHGVTWRQATLEEATLDRSLMQSGVSATSTTVVDPSPLRSALFALAKVGVSNAGVVSIEHQGGVIRVTLTRGTSPEPIVSGLRSAGWRVDSATDEQSRAVLTLINVETEA
ncbi:MAG: hypothetical protein RL412_85 [Pseudomonadota bacterium]